MALAQATLKAALMLINNTDVEADAADGWATAYDTYFALASSNGVPVTTGSTSTLPTPETSPLGLLRTNLTGFSGSGIGDDKIQAGIVAFWGQLSASPALYFAAATAISPPAGLSGIAALLAATFASNVSGDKSKSDSIDAIATDIHNSSLGGTATFPGPITAPIL